MSGLKPLRQCKIVCENWWWNRTLQLYLTKTYGVTWGYTAAPFNTRRRGTYLFVGKGVTGAWYFSWMTAGDFDRCPDPETTAKTLFKELTE